MSDPFSSEYVSSSLTGTNMAVTKATNTKRNISGASTNSPSDADAESGAFEFEPDRYGLGKPKRIVIRGKITRE